MPKTGKTTFAARAKKSLILAFEKGYNALDGVIAQDINSWSDVRAVARELKKPEIREMFDVIAVDTIDIAAKYCEKFVCSQAGVDDLGDIPYGKGYKMMREEFDEAFATMTKLGYSVIFISHDSTRTITREDKSTYDHVQPSLSPDKVNAIIENMADIYGYARLVVTQDDTPNQVRLILRDNTGMISCGCRFKSIDNDIPFTYEALSKAVSDAIDKQVESGDASNFTTDAPVVPQTPEYDFTELKAEFNEIVKEIQAVHPEDFGTEWAPKISKVVAKTLGKGRKVNDLDDSQGEVLSVIVGDLKELVSEG